MSRATHRIRLVYAVYAASLVAAGAVSVLLGLSAADLSAAGGYLAAGWIFAGTGWVVGGFLLVPNVSTYLAPGGIPTRGGAPPIFWPSSAIPKANRPLLIDLREKLSRGSDLGILFAILGVLLLVAGAVASLNLWIGLVAGVAILVLVSILAREAREHPAAARSV